MINDFGVSVLVILNIQFNNVALAMQETDVIMAYTLDG